MTAPETTRLLAQLRTLLDLTNTEIQIAETRIAQARTEAVRRELTQNAANGRDRAEAIEGAIRELGGYPDVIGPFLGRAAAAVKALTEQAEPFDEALLGDLALEDQLLDRARYTKALAVAATSDVEELADRLITAHSATVDWLTTVLAEDALGGPAALRRTPLQMAAGTAVKLVNLPVPGRRVGWTGPWTRCGPRARRSTTWSSVAATPARLRPRRFPRRRMRALKAAERVTRSEGADRAADALHSGRAAVGVLDEKELPIRNYDELNVSDAVAAIKELTAPNDVRVIIAYEEAHKNRQRIVSAAQTRVAAIAQEVVGIN